MVSKTLNNNYMNSINNNTNNNRTTKDNASETSTTIQVQDQLKSKHNTILITKSILNNNQTIEEEQLQFIQNIVHILNAWKDSQLIIGVIKIEDQSY